MYILMVRYYFILVNKLFIYAQKEIHAIKKRKTQQAFVSYKQSTTRQIKAFEFKYFIGIIGMAHKNKGTPHKNNGTPHKILIKN